MIFAVEKINLNLLTQQLKKNLKKNQACLGIEPDLCNERQPLKVREIANGGNDMT